jgi:hypothetical protein
MNQLATLFGMDEASDAGHYYLATTAMSRSPAGGAIARCALRPSSGPRRVPLDADWRNTRMAGAEKARRRWSGATDQVSDVASIDLAVPRSATFITFDYRLDTARHTDQSVSLEPLVRGRFNVELRQRLPYQPLDGRVEPGLHRSHVVHDDESSAI